MNKVFPRKWYKQIDRTTWGKGPWDGEPDREQWSDSMTGYPCLAIRCEIGVWAGYVGVYPTHPAFGEKVDDIVGNICDFNYTDAIRFIEPPPIDPDASVNVDDPKESILAVVRMPEYLWWFGFDFAHAGDLIPSVNVIFKMAAKPGHDKHLGTYKNLAHVKKTCASIALDLCRMTGTKTMDSTRQRVFAS